MPPHSGLARARAYPAESRGLSLRDWERVPAFHVGDFLTTPPRPSPSVRTSIGMFAIAIVAVSGLRDMASPCANFRACGYGLGSPPHPSKSQGRPG